MTKTWNRTSDICIVTSMKRCRVIWPIAFAEAILHPSDQEKPRMSENSRAIYSEGRLAELFMDWNERYKGMTRKGGHIRVHVVYACLSRPATMTNIWPQDNVWHFDGQSVECDNNLTLITSDAPYLGFYLFIANTIPTSEKHANNLKITFMTSKKANHTLKLWLDCLLTQRY